MKTTRSFWNYYRDEPNSEYVGNNERTRIFYPMKDSKSFNYKTKLIGKLPNNEDDLEGIKIVFPLNYLSEFILNLDNLLINCEIGLILECSQNCVLTSKPTRKFKAAEAGPPTLAEVPAINAPPDLRFNVTNCKLYVPVVTLLADNMKINCMKN